MNRTIESREEILDIIKKNGLKLEYASYALQDDIEVVKEAMFNNSSSFGYASNRIRDDEYIIHEYLLTTSCSLEHASKRIRLKPKYILHAIMYHWSEHYIKSNITIEMLYWLFRVDNKLVLTNNINTYQDHILPALISISNDIAIDDELSQSSILSLCDYYIENGGTFGKASRTKNYKYILALGFIYNIIGLDYTAIKADKSIQFVTDDIVHKKFIHIIENKDIKFKFEGLRSDAPASRGASFALPLGPRGFW